MTVLRNDGKIGLNRDNYTFKLYVDTLNLATFFTLGFTENTTIDVYWGDGSKTSKSVAASNVAFTHQYASKGTYSIVLECDYSKIRLFSVNIIGVGGITGALGDKFYQMTALTSLTLYGSSLYRPYGTFKFNQSILLTEISLIYCDYTFDITPFCHSGITFFNIQYTPNVYGTCSEIFSNNLTFLYCNSTSILGSFYQKTLSNLTLLAIDGLDSPRKWSGNLNQALANNNVLNYLRVDGLVEPLDISQINISQVFGFFSVRALSSFTGSFTGKTVNRAVQTFRMGTTQLSGDISGLYTQPIPAGEHFCYSGTLTGDISNWRIKVDTNWNSISYILAFNNNHLYGNIQNLRLPYSGGMRLYLQVNHLTGLNEFINNLFSDRLLISNTNTTIINISSQTDKDTGVPITVTGTYQAGSIAPYYGSIHDLPEAQITEVSASWTTREKIWWLVNAQISSANTTKRYKYSITV